MNYDTFLIINSIYNGAAGALPKSQADLGAESSRHLKFARWMKDIVSEIVVSESVKQITKLATANVIAMASSNASGFMSLVPEILEIEDTEYDKLFMGGLQTTENMNSVLAAYLYETRKVHETPTAQEPIRGVSLEIYAEISSYISWLGLRGEAERTALSLESVKRDFQLTSGRLIAVAQDQVTQLAANAAEMQKARHEADDALATLRRHTEDSVTHLISNIDNARQDVHRLQQEMQKSNAQIAALEEKAGMLSTKRLWDARADASNVAFWLSTGLIFLLLAVVPIVTFMNYEAIFNIILSAETRLLKPVEGVKLDGTTLATALILGRLVVVTFPLAMYFWLIRLIVRFNNRSLALADDARQRHTMMDTYFHLIAKQAAMKDDRALILNALFRPTPLPGADAGEPVTITNILENAKQQ